MNQDLGLRDIHAAPPPDFWPPGPAWWLVAVLALVLLVWASVQAVRRYRAYRWRRLLWSELDRIHRRFQENGDAVGYLREIATYLKRVAVRCAGRRELANAYGSDWSSVLAGIVDDDPDLAVAAEWVAVRQYRPVSASEIPVDSLQRLARRCAAAMGVPR